MLKGLNLVAFDADPIDLKKSTLPRLIAFQCLLSNDCLQLENEYEMLKKY